jgi:hypothetical protein
MCSIHRSFASVSQSGFDAIQNRRSYSARCWACQAAQRALLTEIQEPRRIRPAPPRRSSIRPSARRSCAPRPRRRPRRAAPGPAAAAPQGVAGERREGAGRRKRLRRAAVEHQQPHQRAGRFERVRRGGEIAAQRLDGVPPRVDDLADLLARGPAAATRLEAQAEAADDLIAVRPEPPPHVKGASRQDARSKRASALRAWLLSRSSESAGSATPIWAGSTSVSSSCIMINWTFSCVPARHHPLRLEECP